MHKKSVGIVGLALVMVLGWAGVGSAQEGAAAYAKMAPVEQYLMADRAAEIALARSAAPESVSRDAEVRVLGRQGFETVAKGTNGFVCIVGRSWTSTTDEEFWNPKVRVPMCVNAAAARTFLVRVEKITAMGLAGRTLAEVNAAMNAAVAKKEFAPMEAGAMCYMMGKEGYGGDGVPHWPSHLMFFFSGMKAGSWGGNLAGSPVMAVEDAGEELTQFVVPVRMWADGSAVEDAGVHVHR